MENHKIVQEVREMTKSQFRGLITTLGNAAPEDLTFDEVQYLNGNQGLVSSVVQQALRELLNKVFSTREPAECVAQPAVPTYPRLGEMFELTLDGDVPDNQPLAMVGRFEYNPKGWGHNGPKVAGKQTRRFKLVKVGHCRNLGIVRENISHHHGENPEGQWITAFKAAYPQPDENGPIGVADPSWVSPGGDVDFPCVRSDGDPDFGWAGGGRGDRWRWLVALSE